VLEFILTVLLLELTPGPNIAYLATLSLDRGRRAGLLATVGVGAGLSMARRGLQPALGSNLGCSSHTPLTPVHKDKNNVIAATLTRLTNKADTSGRITKALGDGP
jgi:hypothetical protein